MWKRPYRSSIKLQAEGYEFVTVKELLRRRGVEAENGGIYSKARNNGINLGPLVYEIDGPVAEEHWAYSAAQFVIENGYFPDLSFQNFSPERHITRGMFVTALSRMAGADGESEVSVTFADVTADMPEAPYIVCSRNWAGGRVWRRHIRHKRSALARRGRCYD